MSHTLDFLVLSLSTGMCFIYLASGLLLCLCPKRITTAERLQKYCGIILILLALHILHLTYVLNSDQPAPPSVVNLTLAATDAILLVYAAVNLLKRRKEIKSQESEQVATAPVTETVPAATAEEQPMTAEPVTKVGQEVTEAKQEIAETNKEARGDKQEATVPENALETQKTETALETATEEITVHETLSDEDMDDKIVEKKGTESASEDENADTIEEPNLEDMIFFQKVESLMATKRLFCEQEISRDDVAAAIGTNRTYLTRSIKSATGKTFLEYINGLRISYAATLLTTTNEPLDVIGTLVGFRSKSSYYRAFSAAYGCTPSEYRKK